MFTAFRTSRAFWRVFRLAVLLFALLYTHGVNNHNTTAHMSPVVAVTATATTAATTTASSASSAATASSADFADHDTAPGHHNGDETEHRAESCASGQPPYRADLPARGSTPLGSAELTHLRTPARTVAADAVPTSAVRRDPGNLRV
ncbi:hypothetical protein [Streptomyces sp. NBC_01508]|uniref:hypothetical protein n=1 Tax=Streptomyces sp. NBC_01508 TaxID=2903888 RepID=UPI0038683CF7